MAARGPIAIGAPPIATVVIPTFNSTATLPRALASIDDPGGAIEILVVDDDSDDRVALQAIVAADLRAALIAKPQRSNAAHSRALGLERASGEVVLFLDSDDHYAPGHLARRLALHTNEGASVIVGRFRLSDGAREWDGPVRAYDGTDVEDYLFSQGGDARSSTISVHKPSLRGTTFDARLAKHQDWGFALSAWRNGERIGFDPAPGVTISVDGTARMSAHSNVEASLAFAREYLRREHNRRRFLIGRVRTSIRLGDVRAARQFRAALLRTCPRGYDRWLSAAMMLVGRLRLAPVIHRMMTGRR